MHSHVIESNERPESAVAAAIHDIQRYLDEQAGRFLGMPYLLGKCNVCGCHTAFFSPSIDLYREWLACAECNTRSRYRSIARAVLRAISELTNITAASLADLPSVAAVAPIDVYDTQVPFYYQTNAYPIPDLLSRCQWIHVVTSMYKPDLPLGHELAPGQTVQNLEQLTFADSSLDIVITSDVLEHVRLDQRAHQEIQRVLRPGGIHLFTVPHFRDRETLVRVAIRDPSDPTKDEFLVEPEYHGDANSDNGRALSYRSYGTDLDLTLRKLGFSFEYTKQDYPELGIMNTELFYCRLQK